VLRQIACRRGRTKASDNRQLEEVIIVIKAIRIIGKMLLPSVRGDTVNVAINLILETAGQYVLIMKCDTIQRLNVKIPKNQKLAQSLKVRLQV
jgi:hypothetical protein